VRATVDALRYRININTLEKETGAGLELNDIGAVVIETQKPIFCDPYRRNRATGSFILIDPMTNATVAAGMITGRDPGVSATVPDTGVACVSQRVTPADQQSSAGHRAVTIWLDTASELAYQLERLLFDFHCRVHAVSASETGPYLAEISRALNDAGVIALIHGSLDAQLREHTRQLTGAHNFLHIKEGAAADGVYQLLQDEGIISRFSPGD
jgi:hypothetical protein